MYGSWYMERDRQNFLSFWTIFYAFTSLTTQTIKILKKWKTALEISSLYTSVPKITIIMLHSSWDTTCEGCNFNFSVWAIFFPFTPLTHPKIIILKKWKEHLEISSFDTCVPKIIIRWCTVPEIWCVMDGQTEGQTDKQKKWHIEVGAPPKNKKR